MSSVTVATATSKATIWRRGAEDEFGRTSFEAPVLVSVCYDVGLDQKYAKLGIENIPSSVLWMQSLGSANDPKKGDYIAKGDQRIYANPEAVNTSEKITKVELQDCSLLGEIDDLMIMT